MRLPYRLATQSIIILSAIAPLYGCVSDTASAPVLNAWYQPAAKSSAYQVQKGDTLYSIAWVFGLDYRSLAKINHLHSPYELKVGQRLKMTTAPQTLSEKNTPEETAQRVSPTPASPRLPSWHHSSKTLHWKWPAKGKRTASISPVDQSHFGIDISGRYGEPIKAAAAGQIVYSGSGIRGYGKVIIIKHTATLLSAYAYNSQVYVKVGDIVSTGQHIANMGRNNTNQAMLHFEIRRNGKPINPRRFLNHS